MIVGNVSHFDIEFILKYYVSAMLLVGKGTFLELKKFDGSAKPCTTERVKYYYCVLYHRGDIKQILYVRCSSVFKKCKYMFIWWLFVRVQSLITTRIFVIDAPIYTHTHMWGISSRLSADILKQSEYIVGADGSVVTSWD